MKKAVLFIIPMVIILSCSKKDNRPWSVSSPDGKVIMKLLLQPSGDSQDQLVYEVDYVDGDTMHVMKASRLGITRKDAAFTGTLRFISESTPKLIHDKYETISGKRLDHDNKGHEKEFIFENENGKKLTLTVRAYNNGIAFRYSFPEKDSAQYTITNEITEFSIAGEGKAWMQPYEKPNEWGPAYETAYHNGIDIGKSAPNEAGWCFPALFHIRQSFWAFVSEANINGSFYGAHLQQQATDGIYKIALPSKEEALGHYVVEPTHSLPWATPWRVVIMGKSPGAIVESTMISDLSEPPRVKDISWVKPGRSSWSWWSDHTSPRDYKKIVPFIDFSSAMGWEYSLVDANWNIMKNGNIEQLIKYAQSKNVGLFLWYNSGGIHTNITEQPRDIMSDSVKRKAEFKKLHDWGVRGVKVDFFNSDKPAIMKYYQDILKDAADQQIMVLFHGCTLPRGWERTYPNLMAMEGVRGAEQYWDTIFAENAQTHHTILPFTRNVMGSMDYTPVTFTNSEVPHLTTYAHELSLPVIFESSVTHYADRVSGYKNLPADVLQFLKGIPTTWDETKFVQGYPGKEIVIARRKGGIWFVAGINGEKSPKTLSVDLSFVNKNVARSILIQDGQSSTTFEVKKDVDVKSPVKINMLGRGGFIMQLNQ